MLPLQIEYHHEHNHPMDGIAVLKHKDVSVEARQAVSQYLDEGYRPSAALASFKEDLRNRLPHEHYVEAAADRSKVPDYQFVSR